MAKTLPNTKMGSSLKTLQSSKETQEQPWNKGRQIVSL